MRRNVVVTTTLTSTTAITAAARLTQFAAIMRTSRLIPTVMRNTPSAKPLNGAVITRSEEHTSELQSLMRISYAVFCLKKKTTTSGKNCTTLPTTPNNTAIKYPTITIRTLYT